MWIIAGAGGPAPHQTLAGLFHPPGEGPPSHAKSPSTPPAHSASPGPPSHAAAWSNAGRDLVRLSDQGRGAAQALFAAPEDHSDQGTNLFTALRQLLDRGPGGQHPLSGSAPPRFAASQQRFSPGLGDLFHSIADLMEDWSTEDVEEVKKLVMLLKALERLDGRERNAGAFLQRFGQVLSELRAIHGQPPAALGRPIGQGPQEAVWESYSYVFEFEYHESVRLEATVAELREDGFNVQSIHLEQTQSLRMRVEISGRRLVDPLVLDLDGQGIALTSVENGVLFDITGDGNLDQTAFVRQGAGVLAMDRNGNGTIDDGTELFGDHHGAINGFEELARFDSNGDGRIDDRDEVYQALGVISDLNGDGRLDPSEFMSLESLGIVAIELLYDLDWEKDGQGNILAERGAFLWADGSRGLARDVWFAHEPAFIDTVI